MKIQVKVYLILAIALSTILTACSTDLIPPEILQSPLASEPTEPPPATVSSGDMSMLPTPTGNSPISSSCIELDQFGANLGNRVCIAAKILATENWDNDFVMWLDQNPPTRYVVVRNTFYLGAEGSCMQITGVIQKDKDGRLFIRADDPGQVEPCAR